MPRAVSGCRCRSPSLPSLRGLSFGCRARGRADRCSRGRVSGLSCSRRSLVRPLVAPYVPRCVLSLLLDFPVREVVRTAGRSARTGRPLPRLIGADARPRHFWSAYCGRSVPVPGLHGRGPVSDRVLGSDVVGASAAPVLYGSIPPLAGSSWSPGSPLSRFLLSRWRASSWSRAPVVELQQRGVAVHLLTPLNPARVAPSRGGGREALVEHSLQVAVAFRQVAPMHLSEVPYPGRLALRVQRVGFVRADGVLELDFLLSAVLLAPCEPVVVQGRCARTAPRVRVSTEPGFRLQARCLLAA